MRSVIKIYSNNIKWIAHQLETTKKLFKIINKNYSRATFCYNCKNNLFNILWHSNNKNVIHKITLIRSAHIYKKSKEKFKIIAPYVVVTLSVKSDKIYSLHFYSAVIFFFCMHIGKKYSSNNTLIVFSKISKTLYI